MGLQVMQRSERRFSEYLDGLASVIGHADRAAPLRELLRRAADAG